MKDRRKDIQRWRAAVINAPFRVVIRKVALTLADNFAPDGEVGISKGLLADYAGVSIDSVERAIVALDDAGLLKITPTTLENGASGPNIYGIKFPRAANTSAPQTEDTDAGPTTQGDEVSEGEDTPSEG